MNTLGLKLWHTTMIWYVVMLPTASTWVAIHQEIGRQQFSPWAQAQPAKIASGRAIDYAYPWVVGHSCGGWQLWGQGLRCQVEWANWWKVRPNLSWPEPFIYHGYLWISMDFHLKHPPSWYQTAGVLRLSGVQNTSTHAVSSRVGFRPSYGHQTSEEETRHIHYLYLFIYL